jgi:hypothetical protein
VQLKEMSMKIQNFWKELPEQIKRLSIVIIVVGIMFILVRPLFVPEDFGTYGHFRASAVDEIVSQEVNYAGQEVCFDCHDDVMETKYDGYHKNVACEVCHGPAAGHTEDPESNQLIAPTERGYCPLCHEYSPSRPTGFPQIVSLSHNPMEPCIGCHDPHDPDPPEIPRECEACHAQIARTKALSHHLNIPCTLCHQTPEDHKVNPREVLPSKPISRDFCAQCHGATISDKKGIPKIDLASHEPRYVCWQCHYPHLPEAR